MAFHALKMQSNRGLLANRGGRDDQDMTESKARQSVFEMDQSDRKSCGTMSVMDYDSKCIRKARINAASRLQKKKFRLPLKPERREFRNEYIEYNADFPHRVGIRLEYLMGSTKVQLNDRRYLDRLYQAMSNEEELNIGKLEYDREKVEMERVKKLVVEGEMTPPDDLKYLYDHPVFRVNKMLRRLDAHDGYLQAGDKMDDKCLTLCEPFEYDGKRFFEHLHDTGERDWVPKSVRRAKEKLWHEKVKRAKERRRIAREAEEEEEEVRMLYRSNVGPPEFNGAAANDFELGDMFAGSDDDEGDENASESVTSRADSGEEGESGEDDDKHFKKKPRHLRQTLASPTSTIPDRNGSFVKHGVSDEPQNCRLVVEQMLAEYQEHREKELARKRLYREKEEQEERKERERELERRKRVAKAIEAHEAKSNKAILCIDEPITPVDLERDDSLELLRKSWEIKGGACVGQYRRPRDAILAKYIDDTEDPNELFENGNEVKLLYQREQRLCEEFMRKINLQFR